MCRVMLRERKFWVGAALCLLSVGFLGVGACSSTPARDFGGTAGAAGSSNAANGGDNGGAVSSGLGGDDARGGTSASAGAKSSAGAGGKALPTAGTGGVAPVLSLPGVACGADGECESDHCADGVCCDAACDGVCVACNLPATPGKCTALAAGVASPAGHPTCAKDAATTCGNDGMCDGAGACRKYASGTSCAGGSCDATANSAVTGASCDGKGVCKPATPVLCTPFKCSGAACASKCTLDTDCSGKPCVNGSCGTVADGSLCKADAQCTSGHCIDGLCCNSTCGSSCQACDLSGHEGVCTTLPAAAKPHGTRAACTTGACVSSCDGTNPSCSFKTGAACGTCKSCTVAGVCSPVADGTLDSSCPASVANCAAGACNAAGACKAAAAGTGCAAYSCAESVSDVGQYDSIDHHAKKCDGTLGAAACKTSLNEGCPGSLTCSANNVDCKTSCSVDIDCADGNYCKAGVCTAWLAEGSACTKNLQCATRICDGGKCVQCGEFLDCPQHGDCIAGKCNCDSGCDTGCNSQFDCGSGRAPGCNATTNHCDCFGTPACAAGTICYHPDSAAKGKCLVPMNLPCHVASDCAGATPACTNGVCAVATDNCSRNQDCVAGFCCAGYGYTTGLCSSSCG